MKTKEATGICACIRFTKPFILDTDASLPTRVGSRFVSHQKHGIVVLSYASRGLWDSEKTMDNYILIFKCLLKILKFLSYDINEEL